MSLLRIEAQPLAQADPPSAGRLAQTLGLIEPGEGAEYHSYS
jgi:hypothetical protein